MSGSDGLSDALRRAREGWAFRGNERPDFATKPGPGQESVWDYPRPPALVPDSRTVIVKTKGGEHLLAQTTRAIRICETASPPTFYIPREDVVGIANGKLQESPGETSFCEWKGRARYWKVEGMAERSVGWDYPSPMTDSKVIAGHVSFYPGRVDCFVNGERVRPQAGGFYGGWITDEIVGPFKGDPGTSGW
mmetsp:Transcript_37079/g.90897  ORF Transcript_37079/g.90897 Transcript_37079/m.90897 type:complete len:192 (+) Transcript_37079:130-705(+)